MCRGTTRVGGRALLKFTTATVIDESQNYNLFKHCWYVAVKKGVFELGNIPALLFVLCVRTGVYVTLYRRTGLLQR